MMIIIIIIMMKIMIMIVVVFGIGNSDEINFIGDDDGVMDYNDNQVMIKMIEQLL